MGDLQLFGLEPELSYKWGRGKAGISYSLVKQLDWELADGVPASGISYSDYNLLLRGSNAVQTGVGDDLNNWPNQSLKCFGRAAISEKTMLHVDGRLLWGFQGAKDGLTGLENAVTGLPEEPSVDAAIRRVENVGAYDYDFRLNASISYAFSGGLTIHVFGQNLTGSNRNKRYSYDFSGISKTSPHRVRFTEEPRTFGLRLNYEF